MDENPLLLETDASPEPELSSVEHVESLPIKTDANAISERSSIECENTPGIVSDICLNESQISPPDVNSETEAVICGGLCSSRCFSWWGLQPLTSDEKKIGISPFCCTSICIRRPLIFLAVAIVPIIVLSIMGLTSEAHLDLGIDQFRLSNQDCRQKASNLLLYTNATVYTLVITSIYC